MSRLSAVRVVREAGGIGDVVRIFPTLRALAERHPGADLYLCAPAEFRDLYEHSGVSFHFLPAPADGRRPRGGRLDERRWPYLAAPPGVVFERSIDLYCPAFRYELEAGPDVRKDRIELFAEAAGVWPCEALPRYAVRADEARRARRWIEAHRLARPLVGLQPFSTDPARDWPEAHWRALADALAHAGFGVVVFDGCPGRTRGFRQARCAGKSIAFAAAAIAACDLMIAPDSGLLHLAAAVGTPTVGLFASQRGDVVTRHYPRAQVLTPPADAPKPAGCPWPRPCVWNRPAACTRAALKASGRTCAALSTLGWEEVLAAACKAVRRADQPAAGASDAAGGLSFGGQ